MCVCVSAWGSGDGGRPGCFRRRRVLAAPHTPTCCGTWAAPCSLTWFTARTPGKAGVVRPRFSAERSPGVLAPGRGNSVLPLLPRSHQQRFVCRVHPGPPGAVVIFNHLRAAAVMCIVFIHVPSPSSCRRRLSPPLPPCIARCPFSWLGLRWVFLGGGRMPLTCVQSSGSPPDERGASRGRGVSLEP